MRREITSPRLGLCLLVLQEALFFGFVMGQSLITTQLHSHKGLIWQARDLFSSNNSLIVQGDQTFDHHTRCIAAKGVR